MAEPNRIGQGLEFDTCCVSAVDGLRDEGLNPILYNCNPETVSTDFDTADRLYFEPVSEEDVLAACRREEPRGVMVGLGGQTPLKVAARLEAEGVRILGTSRAESTWQRSKIALSTDTTSNPEQDDQSRPGDGRGVELGFPLMLRPSFVLGGEGWQSPGIWRIWKHDWTTRSL